MAREPTKDGRRLKLFANHAKAHGQKEVTFTDMALAASSTSGDTTSVSASYGVVSIYDFVVDVGITDSDGTVHEIPVIMDTGSSNLAVATSACSNCKKGTTELDIKFHMPEMCTYVEYGSGGWGGVQAADAVNVSLGKLSGKAPAALTAITIQDDFFGGGYSGQCLCSPSVPLFFYVSVLLSLPGLSSFNRDTFSLP